MLPRSMLHSQRSLLLTLVILLGSGFLATSLLSYFASRDAIRESIVTTELPLTSDTLYSEIQKDLVRPVLISAMMAQDTFVRDWAIAGEKDPQQMIRYLKDVTEHYGVYTAFFVSGQSLTYYQTKGVLKHIRPEEPRDAWYYRVRDMNTPYEINVDPDLANKDKLTFFINYRVLDLHDNFIGATGVGVTGDAVIKLIDHYQERYQRSVYFVDPYGRLVLTGAEGGPQGAKAGEVLRELPDFKDLLAQMPNPQSGSYRYELSGHAHFLNVRYIPEMNWYLFVDKREDGALGEIRQSLYANLSICLAVMMLMLVLLNRVIRRFQVRIEAQAMVDSLTGLPNRRGFDRLALNAVTEARRDHKALSAMLLDLDHFKRLNDTHGHLAGDEVLTGFADDVRRCLRESDIICRWGGEEFIILLQDTNSSGARRVAEKIRLLAEQHTYVFTGSPLQVTVSLGLTELHPGDTLQSLIGRADQALYSAKQNGRNQVCTEMAEPA